MPPKIRDVLNMLKRDGWVEVATRGSHRQFKHPAKPGDDVPPGILNSILKQAGLRR